jgi:hypothetical protein
VLASTCLPVRTGPSLAFVPLTPSALPVGAMRRTLSWATRSRNSSSIFASTERPRAPHAYFAAPVAGRAGAAGPDRRLRTAVSSADRAESLGL